MGSIYRTYFNIKSKVIWAEKLLTYKFDIIKFSISRRNFFTGYLRFFFHYLRLNLSKGALPWAICIDPFIAVYLFLHLFIWCVHVRVCGTYTIMCIGCSKDNFKEVYFILSCSCCTWGQVPDWAFVFRQGLTSLPSVSLNSFCSTDRHLTCNLPLNLTF